MKKPIIVSVLLFLLVSCWDEVSRQNKQAVLEAGTNTMKMNFESFIEDGWNKQDTAKFKAISTENFTRNLNGNPVATSQKEMQAHMAAFFKAFPDLHVRRDSIYIKDHTIFMHWTSTGTHKGAFGETEATGKKVKIKGLSQLYFDTDGKIYQEDVVYNELEMLKQLGYSLNPPILE